MIEKKYHRGAVVSARASDIPAWTEAKLTRMVRSWRVIQVGKEVTGRELAAVAKPSRQRRKGPLVRFGQPR